MTDRPKSAGFQRGLETRRAVLGEVYVDRALDRATDFSWSMQELTTEWCWDATWNREGLDRRSRSILNLGMIAALNRPPSTGRPQPAALNRPHEFKIHVRGAVNNGLIASEIQEICIQIGTYCGVPAAMGAFLLAGEVLEDMELA